MRIANPALASLLAASLCFASPAVGQQGGAGLSVQLVTSDMAGALDTPESAVPFRLSLRLSDPATGQTPSGLKLAGWIRPVTADNASCEDTARSLRVTRGTPRGLTDLNGELIAVLNDDGSFGVVDRRLDQNGANMIAAAAFDRRPESMVLDAAGMRALFVLTEEGRIEGADLLTGDRKTLVDGLDEPSDIRATAAGNIWIAESGTERVLHLRPDGQIAARIGLPAVGGSQPATPRRALFLRDTGTAELVGAFTADGRLALLDDWASTLRWSASGPSIADARFIGEDMVISLPDHQKSVEVRYIDDPDNPAQIPIGIDATRLAVSEDGRHAIAYTPGRPLFVILDLATLQLIEAGHMREEMAVQEAAFIGKNLYLLSENGGYVAIFEVSALGRKDRPAPRVVGLARGQPAGGGAGTRIVSFDTSRALVVDRAGQIGLVLHDAMAIGNVPPEDYVRLRSGVPLSIGVIDRGIREVTPGRFETVARIEGGGEHELVLTTGVGGLTTCIRFDVDGDVSGQERFFTLRAAPRDGTYSAREDETIDFEFRDAEGLEIPVAKARFLVSSLQSSWAMQVDAERNEDQRLAAQFRFPHPGLYSISPLGIPSAFELREPVLTQVLP